LKHAFAIDPPGPAVPTAEQRSAIDAICREVVRRRMVTPAIVILEMARPLNFVGAQTLHFFSPFLSAVGGLAGTHVGELHKHLAEFLEHRGSIDYIVAQLEELEAAASASAEQAATSGPEQVDAPRSDDRRGV
jgi:hypothetical protein